MSTITADERTASELDQQRISAPLYRLTLEQYEGLFDSGGFTARDQFHLINGYLVAKLTQNQRLPGREADAERPAFHG